MEAMVRVDRNRHGTGRVGQGQAHRVPKMDQGLKLEWRVGK